MNSEADSGAEKPAGHVRRRRYAGKNPRHFSQKYKELDAEKYPDVVEKVKASGKTPAGAHVSVMRDEVLEALCLRPGSVGVDATLGYGGHAASILERIVPGGLLLGLDVDPLELPKTQSRLQQMGHGSEVFQAFRSNYAGLAKVLAQSGRAQVDFVFADLGCSSMQIDDPARGFTFKEDGPLDMRMNPQRGISAAQWLEQVDADQLRLVLQENADEPEAERIAAALAGKKMERTRDLVQRIQSLGLESGDLAVRRVFQALRIAVNEEFTALEQFLRVLPHCLLPGGRAVVLTFHSGEDRRVKKAFQEGSRSGVYAEVAREVTLAGPAERRANPRSIPAKLRWARRSAI